MTESEYRSSLIGGPSGVYLLCGEETHLILHHAEEMRKRVLTGDESIDTFNHPLFEGDADLDQFYDASLNLPMMSDKLLVEWQAVPFDDMKEDKRERLLAMLEEMNAMENVAVLLTSGPNLFDTGDAKRPSALFTKLSSLVKVVRCDRVNDARLAKWILLHFTENGLTPEPSVPFDLLRLAGNDMIRLSGEITKVSDYALACGRKTVTKDDLEKVVSPSDEESAFGLVNAIAEGDRKKALDELYLHMLRREEPVYLLSKITRTLCDMLSVSLLADAGAGQKEIESTLKLNPFLVRNYLTSAKKLTTPRIRRAVSGARKCDREMKKGASGYAPIEKLIISLPQAR